MSAGLDARLVVDRVRFHLDVGLAVPPGRVLALLGPNGAGKSTALRALAGLVRLDDGHVRLAGRVLDDAHGVVVAPEDRGVGVVPQDSALFPHLSALENVAFGLRARGTPRRPARARAQAWLDRVGLADLCAARPGELSGGQAQRVALARALAPEPGLLLLDEPLSALDAGTRLEVRADLARHLTTFTGCTVLVTHDPVDAMVLADEVVVVEDGRVVQRGAPADVASAPVTGYVARLVGLSLLRGPALRTVRGTAVDLGDGVRVGAGRVVVGPAPGPLREGAPVRAVVPPTAVRVLGAPCGGARGASEADVDVVTGRVLGLEPLGGAVRVRLDVRGQELLADVPAARLPHLALAVGAPVRAAVDRASVVLHAG